MTPEYRESVLARQEPSLAPVSSLPLAVLAYNAIRRAILSSEFRFGERLPEAAISSSLGMSRQPVREALIMLRNDGLVVERPRLGTFVCEMSVRDFIDLYNIRIPLEVMATRLAVRTGADLSAVEAVLADMKDAQDSSSALDVADISDLEYRFHREVFVASGNVHLLRVFESLSGSMQLALTLDNSVYEGTATTVEEHVPLVAALRSGVERVAADAMRDHIVASFLPVVTRLKGDINDIVWPDLQPVSSSL